MSKLIAVVLICGLVLALYLGVFQDGISPAIVEKGVEVEKVIEGK